MEMPVKTRGFIVEAAWGSGGQRCLTQSRYGV